MSTKVSNLRPNAIELLNETEYVKKKTYQHKSNFAWSITIISTKKS